MTPDELDGALRLLEAYWPGEWTTERFAVWSIELAELDAGQALAALRSMAIAERFPTIAAFHEHARPVSKPAEYRPELVEPADPARARETIAEARARIVEARARIEEDLG